MSDKLYFAYGSNINLNQMAFRCPDAKVVEPVVLEDYELLFRGNRSGYGVATIRPKEGNQVHGLLWKITDRCERSLDMYEGYPHLYGKYPVTVTNGNGKHIAVMAYIMNNERNLAPVPPSISYFDGIQEGFQQNGLPVKALEQSLRQCWREVDMLAQQKPHKKKKGWDTHER
jgi:gamma-glutamylcyclotransferase (GGCT)/AIG2-like uncharacterized protein YtfP